MNALFSPEKMGGRETYWCQERWKGYFLSALNLAITINVPVVYMARCGMILRRAISIYEGHWKGWALEIDTFLGPEMATSELRVLFAL
jgi:hypothetical protein